MSSSLQASDLITVASQSWPFDQEALTSPALLDVKMVTLLLVDLQRATIDGSLSGSEETTTSLSVNSMVLDAVLPSMSLPQEEEGYGITIVEARHEDASDTSSTRTASPMTDNQTDSAEADSLEMDGPLALREEIKAGRSTTFALSAEKTLFQTPDQYQDDRDRDSHSWHPTMLRVNSEENMTRLRRNTSL